MSINGKLAVCAASLILACACTLNGHEGNEELSGVGICPADAVGEARATLGFVAAGPLRLDDLLERASNEGFTVEETTIRLRNTQCVDRPDDQSMTIYVIHAGFDESRSYTRHFVVIPDDNGMVTNIEVQRAYLAQ